MKNPLEYLHGYAALDVTVGTLATEHYASWPKHEALSGAYVGEMLKPQAREDQNSRCPFCHDTCLPEDTTGDCLHCEARQHLACFFEHGKCPATGCEEAELQVHPEVTVSYADVQAFESVEEFLAAVAQDVENAKTGAPELEAARQAQLERMQSSQRDLRRFLMFAVVLSWIPLFLPAIWSDWGKLAMVTGISAIATFAAFRLIRFLDRPLSLPEPTKAPRSREPKGPLGPTNFWRDILGQDGFDPIFGMTPLPSKLPLLDDDEEELPPRTRPKADKDP